MTERDAVKILMLSPLYFRLTLIERSQLLVDFYATHQVNQLPSPEPAKPASHYNQTCH